MIALIQRVSAAHVDVGGETVGRIGAGLLALVAVQPGDGETQAQRLLERLLGYRVFADADGRMNRSLARDRRRPAAGVAVHAGRGYGPGHATRVQHRGDAGRGRALVQAPGRTGEKVAMRRWKSGRFGAHMRVSLINDGPVTFWLEAR